MAYKGIFAESIKMIPDAITWAERQNITELRDFFTEDARIPLYCLASGGSFSAVDYAALLYEGRFGVAKSLTPLSLSAVSDEALKRSKIFFTTSNGSGFDEKYVAKRSAKLNPEKTSAIGPYSQAIRVGNFIYTSGQIPIDHATGSLVEGGIREQTRQSLTNVKAILAEAGLTMSNVVKTTVFMADMNDFADMNAVYAEFFYEPFPARSAVAVKSLPKGALVEIEVVAEV